MRKICHTVFCALRIGPYVIYCYFFWILRYSRHPEKYPFQLRYKRVKKLVNKVMNAFKLDFRVENSNYLKEMNKPFLGVSNHRYFLDPIFYIYLSDFPVSFVAKKEAYKIPFIGRVMRAIDVYFIDRDDVMSQVRIFKSLAKRLQKGDVAYFIFPEGTRLKDHSIRLLDYKDGAIKPAYWGNVDILNATLYATDFTLDNKKKGMKKRPVFFTFFKAIKYQEFKDNPTTEVMPYLEKESLEALNKMADAYQKMH